MTAKRWIVQLWPHGEPLPEGAIHAELPVITDHHRAHASVIVLPVMTRQRAIRIGLPWYDTGKPCKRGHYATRSTANRNCNECLRQRRSHFIKPLPKSRLMARR